MLYVGPMLDMEPQQVHHRPEPCMVSYGGVTCFPQLYNNHTILPPRYLPENHGQLAYMFTQYNGEHCNTFMIPSPNHDYFPYLNNHQTFERNRSLFMDGSNGVFKRSGFAGPITSEGNRATGAMGFDFDHVVVHNSSHLVHVGQLVQAVPTPWLDQHSSGGFSWNRAHGVPYLQDMGLHGYQVAAMSRNSTAFMHPPPMRPHQGPHNVYHPPLLPPPPPPMPSVQAQNMELHLQLPSTSHRHSTSTSTAYPFQNDAAPRFVGLAQPHGARVYEARQQQLLINAIARHHSFPDLRILPEDEVLELGQLIGDVDSGLPDNFISEHLKTRTFVSFTRSHSEDLLSAGEEPIFCVICQMEFEDQEKIGMLDCRHEYHVDCIKKWLIVKNNCPICKSTAIN